MENIHLWQYFVIAGPAAFLGGLAVWAIGREYERGLEDALLSQPERMPARGMIVPIDAAIEAAGAMAPKSITLLGPASLSKALSEIAQERARQDDKWGEQNHNMADYYTILGEEFGEVGKAICEHRLQNKGAAPIRAELIQTAAVAVAMVEAFDRQEAV